MKKEKRNISFKDLTIRSAEKEGKKYIEGIIPYNSKSVPIWGVTEIIDRTAFNKTIADKKNVYALYNHDDSKVLGSTKSGTLELESDDDSLICRCELPNTSWGNDTWEIIQRGDTTTLSFGFIPVKWEDSNNGKQRTLKEVNLQEVSFCVPFPAYPETNSNAFLRTYLKKRNINMEIIEDILTKIENGEELTEEEKKVLKEFVAPLNEILKPAVEQPEESTVEENTEKEKREKEEQLDKDKLEIIKAALELDIINVDDLEKEIEEKENENE